MRFPSSWIIVCLLAASLVVAIPTLGLSGTQTSDVDSFEVDPSGGGDLARWEETNAGSGITHGQGPWYHWINSSLVGGGVTSTKTFTRPLRTTTCESHTKIMIAQDLANETGQPGWDTDSPIFEDDFENNAETIMKWHDINGPGNDITIRRTTDQAHAGSYSIVGTSALQAFSNSSTPFTNVSDFRLELWIYLDITQDSGKAAQEKAVLSPIWTSNLEVLSIYWDALDDATDLSQLEIRTDLNNGSNIILYNYFEDNDFLWGKWIGIRVDRHPENATVYWNLDDTGWEQKALVTGLISPCNVSSLDVFNLAGGCQNSYVDDVSIMEWIPNTGVSGAYELAYYVEGNNGEEAGIILSNTEGWKTYYTRDNAQISQVVPGQPPLENTTWYTLSIVSDLYDSDLRFLLKNEENAILWKRKWLDFWQSWNTPEIFEAKNLTLNFRLTLDGYKATSGLWWDWARAPFQEQRFIATSISSDAIWTDHSPYAYVANGSGTAEQSYKLRIEHFQAYSGLATLEADWENNSDTTTIQILLRYVDADGSTGSGNNLLYVQYTARRVTAQNTMHVKLIASSPYKLIEKTFSTSTKASIGFLFWKQDSTNSVWLKASLFDELNATQKTVLALDTPIPDDSTNEYELWHTYIYSATGTESKAEGTIFSTNLYRSRSEILEPALPWPEKPPEPVPPYIPIISEIIALVGGAILFIVSILEAILSPIFAVLTEVFSHIFNTLNAIVNQIFAAIGEALGALFAQFQPWIDQAFAAIEEFLAFVEDIIILVQLFMAWLLSVIVYLLTILLDPVTWATLAAFILTILFVIVFGPSILSLVGWSLGFGGDLGDIILGGPINRAKMLFDIYLVILGWCWNLFQHWWNIIRFLVSLIPFIG